MPKQQLLYCATDKEIFDLLMSSKQRMTETILLGIARERGIFYSPREPREVLINNLSLLPYDYDDLDIILGHRETTQRTEKVTSITLRAALNVEDIKAVCSGYKEQATSDEKVTVRQDGSQKYTAKINYSELDYSKTRLLQRRNKEADIEFLIQDNETTIRMPANSKARQVVAALKDALDARAKTDIPAEAIELSHLKTPEARTSFFTSLITRLDGYQLENVTDIKVESKLHEAPADGIDDLEDDEDGREASAEDRAAGKSMLSVVENIALKGQSLLGSTEYQQLKQKGFYITSILWKSRQEHHPYNIIEFDAGFDEPREGKGFKYNVRGVYRYQNGTHTTTLRQIPKEEKAPLLTLLERTARAVIGTLVDQPPQSDTGGA
jgi:hypothetical protein